MSARTTQSYSFFAMAPILAYVLSVYMIHRCTPRAGHYNIIYHKWYVHSHFDYDNMLKMDFPKWNTHTDYIEATLCDYSILIYSQFAICNMYTSNWKSELLITFLDPQSLRTLILALSSSSGTTLSSRNGHSTAREFKIKWMLKKKKSFELFECNSLCLLVYKFQCVCDHIKST